MRNLNIAFIGNFIPPYSTENDRKWSLEKLGHKVIALQENKVTQNYLLSIMYQVDLLLYSHTHDPAYVIDGLKYIFSKYKDAGIPTASVHLDRWAWLDRAKDVGKEATWFTEYQFMADASPEAVELYDKLNLNWHYLKPGVVERDCFQAMPNRIRFPHEIIFVGSRGYHPEYPFRRELIDFLKTTYGDRFGHYGNDGIEVVRGNELNVLYSTAKLAVGDSCFGGRPNYVSDRYYETRGRGGFLLHPDVTGVDDKGIGFYKKGNLESLKIQIDKFLDEPLGAQFREVARKLGFEWVKNHETYTHRAQEMLDIIFPNG